jgi:hypothetical protein
VAVDPPAIIPFNIEKEVVIPVIVVTVDAPRNIVNVVANPAEDFALM